MENESKVNRLFVPLSSDPYRWFQSGLKKWELRKYGRQYTEKHVYLDRRVELRRGYSDTKNILWGEITSIVYSESLRKFFESVDYREVIPIALNKEDAIAKASKILNIEPDEARKLIGFQILID